MSVPQNSGPVRTLADVLEEELAGKLLAEPTPGTTAAEENDRLKTIHARIVSDFENAGSNRVSIEYDEKDPDAEAAAIRLANNVVACHVSAAPTKVKGQG